MGRCCPALSFSGMLGQILIGSAVRLNLDSRIGGLKAEERLHKDVAVSRRRQAELTAGKCLGLAE